MICLRIDWNFKSVLVTCLLILLFLPITSTAQDGYVDSLQNVTKGNYADTTKVNATIDLSVFYLSSDLDRALQYANEAKLTAREIKFEKGLAYAHKWAGVAYYYKSDYLEALDEWKRSNQIFDSINDLVGQSNILSNIGAIFFNQGAYDKALENYSASLRLAEEAGHKLRIITALLNIGAVNVEKPETQELALENYQKAMSLAKELEDGYEKDRAIGTAALNIGEIYYKQDDIQRAIEYYNQSLEAFQGLDGEPSALIYLSKAYSSREEYRRAEEYQNQAYEKAQENEDDLSMVHALVAMAETQELKGNINSAIYRYKMAIPVTKKIPNAIKDLGDIYKGLSNNYSLNERFDSAFKYQTLFLQAKDSLDKSDKRLDILQRDFQLERREIEISQLNEKTALQETINSRQEIIIYLVIAGFVSVIFFLYIAQKQKRRISKEKERSEELLLNILPYEVAEELKEKGSSEAQQFDEVTVLFTDFKGFTQLSQILSAQELVKEVNEYFKAFDHIVSKYHVEKIKTIGDAYMAASGVPLPQKDAIVNAVNAAFEMQDFVINRQKKHTRKDIEPFSMRVGIHTGPIVAGIVGVKKFQYDIWGDTVNTASRMESNGEPGMVNISQSTYDKIKDRSEFEFEKREKVHVKGKGEMQMYFVKRKNS
jgi:adenylate cyclase